MATDDRELDIDGTQTRESQTGPPEFMRFDVREEFPQPLHEPRRVCGEASPAYQSQYHLVAGGAVEGAVDDFVFHPLCAAHHRGRVFGPFRIVPHGAASRLDLPVRAALRG